MNLSTLIQSLKFKYMKTEKRNEPTASKWCVNVGSTNTTHSSRAAACFNEAGTNAWVIFVTVTVKWGAVTHPVRVQFVTLWWARWHGQRCYWTTFISSSSLSSCQLSVIQLKLTANVFMLIIYYLTSHHLKPVNILIKLPPSLTSWKLQRRKFWVVL